MPGSDQSISRTEWIIAVCLVLAVVAVSGFHPGPGFLPAIYLAAVTPTLWRIDVTEFRLPDIYVLPGLLLGLSVTSICLVAGLAAAIMPDVLTGCPELPGGAVALALLIVVGPLALAALIGGMGWGDVKLGALCAVIIGLSASASASALVPAVASSAASSAAADLVVASAARVLVGAVVCGGWVAVGAIVRRGWGSRVAFGPPLLCGFWLEYLVLSVAQR
ncbi:MAG: hypothetical protein ACTJHU_00970 [Mycetocola sp.]